MPGRPAVQPDITVERKGPRVDAPDKAVNGFLGSVGLTREACEVRETPKGAFLFAVGPVLILYFPITIAGSGLARSGTMPAYPALWAGNAVLLVAGLLLTRRAAR